jgi:hypothetical protein
MKKPSSHDAGISKHGSSSAALDKLFLAAADSLEQFAANAAGDQAIDTVSAAGDATTANSSTDNSPNSPDIGDMAGSSGGATFTDKLDTALATDGTSANQYSATRFSEGLAGGGDSNAGHSGSFTSAGGPADFAHDSNLANDEPGTASVFSAASSGPTLGGTTSGGSTSLVTGATSAGLLINVTYGSSVNSAPVEFKTVVGQVVEYLESHFSDSITINITVGWGEVGGSPLSAGALGSSLTYLTSLGYTQVINSLAADGKGANDASAVASLPAVNPNGGTYWVTTAEAKALGLMGASSNPDGFVGFNSSAPYDYNNSDGVTAGQYDFFGVVAHEITEVMGRMLLVGGTIGPYAHSYVPYDLFHFSGPGVHDYAGSVPGYFSIDNGVTNLNTFNTVAGGDYGDWAGATPDAGNAFASPGKVQPISDADLVALDAIGWDAASVVAPPPPPPPSPVPGDLTVSNLAFNITPTDSTVSFNIDNAGPGSAAASTAGIYLSSDNRITTSDVLIGTVSTTSLTAGASDLDSLSLSLPAPTAARTYYLGVIADSTGVVTETSETDNTASLRVILGTNGNNSLAGTASNDTMIGFDGNDTLKGAAGVDTLVGGTGNDHFLFKALTDGGGMGDIIVDFTPGADSLDFSRSTFGRTLAANNTATGNLDPSHFVSGATEDLFASTGPGFWFNTSNHTLYFDSNGNVADGQIAMAQLENGVTITNSNIHLV